MAKRIIVFNHKGGVSKTTSAYNIGWMMSKRCRVLLVDADPQCNLSALVLGDDFERYYTEDATKSDNIKDGVAAAFDGKPTPIAAVPCRSPVRAPQLHLLAGHANLSAYDAALTFAQTSNNAITTLQNLPGAFSELIRLTEEQYNIDYTLIDLNPSLSAINQNLFLISHAFIVPTNPDPFSIMALDTLRTTLPRWVAWKKDAVSVFSESAYPLNDVIPKFLGTLIQRFNIRKGRAARPYRDNIDEINTKISTNFVSTLSLAGMAFSADEYGRALVEEKYCLSQIPDFQGLLPKSHEANVPVFELTNSEIGESGNVLEGMIAKRELFKSQFYSLADEIIRVMAYA